MPEIIMKTVHIYDAEGEIEANLVQGFLESHGIKAFIGAAKISVGWMFNETVATRLPKGLYVLEDKAEQATNLLKERSV